MSGKLQDQVAIVTGAGAIGDGISNGRAAALVYARHGAIVLAVDKDAEAAQETQRQVLAEGGKCEIYVGDLSDSHHARAMVEFSQANLGARIDILHNNIGVLR